MICVRTVTTFQNFCTHSIVHTLKFNECLSPTSNVCIDLVSYDTIIDGQLLLHFVSVTAFTLTR